MTLLFVCATQEELAALLRKTNTPDPNDLQALSYPSAILPPPPCGPFLRLLGPAGLRADAYALICGVGPINAALACGYAIETLRLRGHCPDLLLNCGLAGAYDLTQTPLQSLCLVTEEIWPEYGLHDGHTVVAQAFKWPQLTTPDGPIYDRLLLEQNLPGLSEAERDRHLLATSALTVAGVTASFDRARELWQRYRAPLEGMEGFAVAYTGLRLGVPVAELRVVSNKAGPRRADEKDFPGAHHTMGEILPTLNLI